MSLTKSNTRRLSLLAGSSFGLAVFLSALPAAAAVNPCGANPSTNGAAPDVIVCPVASYGTGIEHTSQGNLDLTVQLGSSFGTGGVVTEAGLAQDDLIVRLTGTATASSTNINSAFPIVFDVESQEGDILVDINVPRNVAGSAFLFANNAATTHFVRAVSTDGGDVTVSRSGGAGNLGATGTAGVAAIEARSVGGGDVVVTASGNGRRKGIVAAADSGGSILITGNGLGTNSTDGHTGIEAIISSGAGDITIGTESVRASGTGRLYGIRAETSGSGNISITAAGSVSTISPDAVAGIYAATGTGLLSIDATLSSSGGGGSYGVGVRTIAGGNATINLGDVELQGEIGLEGPMARLAPLVHSTAAAGTTTTINVNGLVRASRTGGLFPSDDIAIVGDGAGQIVMSIPGELWGRVDLSDLTGGFGLTIASGGSWRTYGASQFSGASETFTIAEGGLFVPGPRDLQSYGGGFPSPGQGDPTIIEVSSLDFGAGDDVLVNQGTLAIGARYWTPGSFNTEIFDRQEVELTFLNLETFENSGAVIFGERLGGTSGTTDGVADDVLIMPGTDFVGSGDSVIMIDVNLNASQGACDIALRDPVTFSMPAADCMSLPGGSTSGVTKVMIKEQFPFDRGAYTETGIVIVDVEGGTGATGDFVIHEDSAGYNPAFGGVIDKGVFIYPLVYDPDTQQHKLTAAPSPNVMQYPLLAQATHGIWRNATGTWFDRQADVRGEAPEALGGGVWLRVSSEFADRDVGQTIDVAGNPFDIDNTFEQDTFAVTTGVDLMTGGAGPASYVLGVMGGYTNSKITFDVTPNTAQFDGYIGGVYGGVVAGGFFLDAMVNANKLIMDHDVPGFGLLPVGTITSTDLVSYGAQAEAGWRFPVMDGVFAEPLAAVSYVQTKFDDLLIVAADASRQGVDVSWDDPVSLRASLGARLGLDQDYGTMRAQYSVLGRVWNEFEDETAVMLAGQGDPALLTNEFTGAFSELGVGASVYSVSGAVSGFLNLGARFADDYQAQTGSVGVRVAW